MLSVILWFTDSSCDCWLNSTHIKINSMNAFRTRTHTLWGINICARCGVRRMWSAQRKHISVNKLSPRDALSHFPVSLSAPLCLCPSCAALSPSSAPLPPLISFLLWHAASVSSFTLHLTVHPSCPCGSTSPSHFTLPASLLSFHLFKWKIVKFSFAITQILHSKL